jgi:predicted metal-dependent hydrolase
MIIDFLSDFYGKTRPRTKRNKLGYKKPRPKLVAEPTIWEINEQEVPVELFREPKRTSWRFSFVKGGKLNVRIPLVESGAEEILLREVKKRLSEKMGKKPALFDFFNPKTYYGGDTVIIGREQYLLKVFIEARETNTGKLVVEKGRKIIDMRLNAYIDEDVRQKAISTIISRIASADALPSFSNRVFELNDKHFQKHIKKISFKQNHSNWGSCSSTGNLNFSSRLLFAPPDVQDYVIIHELAHLVELNHSNAFWNLVYKAMPDYDKKEKWLKENGPACRY